MFPVIPSILNITTRQEYVELRDTFDVIFMDMNIAEPAMYLDSIYSVISKSSFMDEFKERCKEYFPKYPKRMSAWYCHAVINTLEDEKERAKETFAVITQFTDEKITSQMSCHTFEHISSEELKARLKVLDKIEGMATISLKYAQAFYQYAKKLDSSTQLLDSIKDYSKDKQFYMLETLVEKGWFTPEKYKDLHLTNNTPVTQEDFYNMVLEKENNIEYLAGLTPILLDFMIKGQFKEKSLQAAFFKSTEKNKYFIENLVTNEEAGNKAIDYAMKYETAKDINNTVSFINYNLVNHFNQTNTLEATQVCLMISRCFIQRIKNPQFCDLIVGFMNIIKEGDKHLYEDVYKKITSDEKFYIYELDKKDRYVTFGTPEFKDFLSQLLFESLSKDLDSKPVKKQLKI